MLYMLLTVFGIFVPACYITSYYGWVRTWHGRHDGHGVYSLDYRRVPGRLSGFLEWAHYPLRMMDSRVNARLYETQSTTFPSHFDSPPEFDGKDKK